MWRRYVSVVAAARRNEDEIVMIEQKWPQRLWIVRHGQSAGNVARDAAEVSGLGSIDIADRDMDVPLSALGEQQARALGRWIGEMPSAMRPNVVLCSPYVRARTTAELVVDAGWRNQRATRRLKGATTYIVVPDGGHGATTAEIRA